jgi:subtilisin family serine protease
MTRIVHEQVGRIASEFQRQRGITIKTVLAGDGVAFSYAAGQFLVREQHIERVRTVLRQNKIDRIEPVIGDVRLVHLTGAARSSQVLDQLDLIDQELGEGVATPNHVLTVAPEAGPCPATEPQEVYFETEPYPGPRADHDGRGKRIYIADTGLLSDAASAHPWLKGVTGEPDPLEPGPGRLIEPYAGHGTFVAGVARCMAPRSDVFVSSAFKIAGSALESDFVRDLDKALGERYDIFNLSVTTPTRKDLRLLGFDEWLTRLRRHEGVVCVVAAGNNGSDVPFWPAAFHGMVSVGALTADWHNRASFSNHGDWVKVYAPGRDIINAYATGTYICQDAPYERQRRNFYGMAMWSGTSFSTPMVSGLIAAQMSLSGENGRQAADALLAKAHKQAIPGVGPVLLPY